MLFKYRLAGIFDVDSRVSDFPYCLDSLIECVDLRIPGINF